MTRIGTYGMINAKVRAMRSFLISPATYRSLIDAKGLRGFSSALAETPYRDSLKTVDITEAGQFEALLFRKEINQFRAIEKFSRRNPHQLIGLLLERYDCERLKILLRYRHRHETSVPDVLYESIVYPVDAGRILSANKPADLIPLLEGTPYRSILTETVSEYEAKKSLFPVEVALDKRLFQALLQCARSFRKKDRTIAERMLGIEIDIKNIEWFYRYRQYYDLASADIIDLLLPHGFRFTADMVRRLAGGENLFQVIGDAIPGIEFPGNQSEGEPQMWESLVRMLNHLLFHESGNAFGGFPFSIGSILGYFYRLRFETRNIQAIFYAKYYGLTAEETENQLIYQG